MGIRVDEPGGARWNAGVDLIVAGEGGLDLPGVSISRRATASDPDPRVRVEIFSRSGPRFLTLAAATDQVAHARRLVRSALDADPRLRQAFADHGVVRELVARSGERGTSVRVATVGADGSLTWVDGQHPGR